MLSVAYPDAAERRSNGTFEALMWALARPGDIRQLPEPGLAGLVESLIDIECVAHADTPELRRQVAATGATAVAEIGSADHVFLALVPEDLAPLRLLRCGSALYPDDGATLAVTAGIGGGQALRLSGPGIEGTRELALGLPAGFWRLREALCAYPEGFDLFVVDGARVVGLPRSTLIEVL